MVFNRLIKAPVIFIAFLFCFVQTTAFAAPKQVTLQLFWKHQFEFAGYYAAKELGFYEEVGLDVNIREYQLGMDVNEEVLSGRAQFAAVSSSAIKNYLQGKPIKLLANIFKHSALVLLSHRDAGIRTPGDLYGKRLMLTSQERNAVEFLSFFAKNGIDSKKLSYVDHNFDPMATVNGQADVMSAYITNQPFILQQKGIPYNILDPAAYGVDFYGDFLVTSAKLSEQRPELVEAFKEASLMGWAYALQHPGEIIELILSKYNTSNKSCEALRYEATETAKLILPETYPLGSIDPERVRRIANAMYEAGVIKDEPDIEFLIFGQELKSWLPLTQSDLALTDLTPDEQAWLAAHKKIVVGGEKDWAPFDFVDKAGKYTGIANDYLKIIGEKLGIEVEVITGPSWNELLSMIRHKEIDVLPAIYHFKEREDYVHYTTPYIRVTEFVFSCSDNNTISSFNDLQDKTIIVVKGYTIEGFLRSNYPEFNLITAPTIQDALKNLITGKADAFINDIISTSYHIKELSLVGIKPIAPVPFPEPTVHLAVRKDWPELVTILNKGLASISQGEMNAIHQKWIPIEMGALTPKATAPVSYGRMIIYGIAVFLILSLLVWVLIRINRKEDLSVSFGSRWFRVLVLAGLSIIIIIICLLSWFTLERNREKVLASVGESFQMILNTANDKLNIYVAQKKSFMKLFGHDPELISITRRLLAVSPNRDGLPVSEALLDIRKFFKNNEKIFANTGVCIINPDHISIGSMRDANVGTKNLISSQRPDLFRRAFQGEVLFVPSIKSNVPLGNPEKTDGGRKQDTQFFIGPILDLKGQIIAVMVLHADPSKNFSQAFHTHEMFKSDETYAINSEGLLLSESRFNDHLRQIGLIEKGQQSALNIEIRDPGVNMVDGHHPIWERSKQPLTHIASRAIQLKLDMDKVGQHQGHSKIEVNTKASRDYRGVPVFGAWLWSADLGFGLATKIDADEALSAYHMMRMTVFGILGFTLLLLVGAILFVLILGERASRALIKARDHLEEKIEERTKELRKNQERLALAEERSRLLLDSAGEGIFGVDTKGRINFVNLSAVSMLGYPEKELIGQEVRQLIHHFHSNGSSYPLENSPIFKAYTDGTSHHVEDEVLRRKDETCFHVEYTATPMKKDGRLAGAVFTFNNTTERKQAQEALRQNMEDLERFSKLTVGREERMIELKKKINELLRGSGKPNKYKIVT